MKHLISTPQEQEWFDGLLSEEKEALTGDLASSKGEGEFVNLTPHPIVIVDDAGKVLRVIEPSGTVARLSVETVSLGTVDGIPATRSRFGKPTNLPEWERGKFLIVSQMIKSALPARHDLCVPAEVVRDATGMILGCKSLGF